VKLKSIAAGLGKLAVTVGIFVAIFIEIGGGYRPVDSASLSSPGAFAQANPAYPGIVGRLKARLRGQALPSKVVPVGRDEVCKVGAERAVFVRTARGWERFKLLKHCHDDRLATVFVKQEGHFAAVPSAKVKGTVYFRIQGFQLVPAELGELWQEVKSLDMAIFLPWILLATLVKLIGIFANIIRWQVLLAGQGIRIGFGYLCSTYFIGRYFGIVTPSTMGLDGWRLYDTIRLTRKPIECTTVLAVERIIGMVGLLAVILGFMPFATAITQGQSFGELVAAMKIPLAGAVFFAVLVLLQPAWFEGLLRFVPTERGRRFLGNVIQSATAYSSCRRYLLIALGMAVFGQVTTTLMYFCNSMAIHTANVRVTEVLFASAVMTFGTFVAPSASGEGVRELVFVWLLGSKTGAIKAFLIGHIGFWIEKLPLSIPGGLFLLLQSRDVKPVTEEDLARLKAETGQEA